MLESYDKFIEDKVVGLGADVKAMLDDFNAIVQSFEEDKAVLKKVVLMQETHLVRKPFPKFMSQNQRALIVTKMLKS